MNHDKIIEQQLLEQAIVEESEYSGIYGGEEDLEPTQAPELFEQFLDQGMIMGKKKSQSGGKGKGSKQSNLHDLIKAAKLTERKQRVERMADGVRQRSHTFKSLKDYDRKDKSWKKDQS